MTSANGGKNITFYATLEKRCNSAECVKVKQCNEPSVDHSSSARGGRAGVLPEAACVERLSTLQTSSQILKVISELLVLSKLHHVIEVLHMLDDCIQLENTGTGE